MKKILFFTIMFFLFNINNVKAESSFADEASKWVDIKGRETIEAFSKQELAEKYEAIDKIIYESFDIEAIGKFVLGRYWTRMNDKLKQSYLTNFENYALAMYKSLPLSFNPDISFKIIGVVQSDSPNDESVTVRTEINDPFIEKEKNENIYIDFRVRKSKTGFKVYDVKLAGASLLLVYRDKFAEMIREREDDLYWFVDDLGELAYRITEQNNRRLK